ncbi:hypothetical protein F5Y09DRAFT_322823 [Xylaria sp. FL1042]|nr:hypothetical protein F5Y09DRAFT_322823 [Xylaria sp. FL1042]
MPLLDSVKRLCLWTLIWGGLPAQANTELLVIGTPSIPTLTSTITRTTTVTYKPSLIPGNPQYTLVGCYGPISRDREHIFGPDDYDVLPDIGITPGNLTIDTCLRGCGSATPANNGEEGYMYAGLRNGSECRCGNQLPSDAHRLSADDCIAPCSGDPRLSCGGRDNVAVYSLISANSKSASPTLTNSETKTSSTVNPSEVKGTATQATAAAAAASNETSSDSGTHGKPVSKPTIAAVTGSLSGAVLVAAGFFLCYRAHMRKKQIQNAHVKAVLERRTRPSISRPMFPDTDIHSYDAKFTVPRPKHDEDRIDSDSGRSGGNKKHEDDEPRLPGHGGPVTNTSAPESGGLHPRTNVSFAGNMRLTPASDNREGRPSGGEVRSRPMSPHIHAQAASSAVQWRDDGLSPMTPATPHKRTKSSTNIATPPLPAARIDGLGDRAWHRRKLSTPYAPPPPGVAGRNIIARNGPPSGPPDKSLPPTPPKAQGRSQLRPRVGPGGPIGTNGVDGNNTPPPRPRRSFDTVEFEPALGQPGVLKPGGASLGAVSGTGKAKTLGMSITNLSTPALGRYGSLSRSNRANTDLESPVLGWQPSNGRGQRGTPQTRGGDPVDTQPKVPALPPVAPGERFDHRRWRGTLYAEPYEGKMARRRSGGDDISPLSASSTGTSILFGLDEFDRRL